MTTDVLKLVRPETGAAFAQRHSRANAPRPRGSLLQARARLALRGGLYVALQAAGVSAIAQESYALAFVTFAALNYLWSGNVRATALGDRADRACYALGAALGGCLGMWVGTLL